VTGNKKNLEHVGPRARGEQKNLNTCTTWCWRTKKYFNNEDSRWGKLQCKGHNL